MLTISELASYAGVTVRAVRHYHQVGLLPEPARDSSGYRRYDATDVVRLIRIRTLADAGVPLARVQTLLDAEPEEFGCAVAQIDVELRAEIRRLQQNRKRIAALASGDSLALPPSVVDYLERLRETAPEAAVESERDAWILIAARWPDRIDDFMADKMRQLDDPRLARFYQLLVGIGADGTDDDAVLEEAADLLADMSQQAADEGQLEWFEEELGDATMVRLLDEFALGSHPLIERLQELMLQRGWSGWTRLEQVSPVRSGRSGAR